MRRSLLVSMLTLAGCATGATSVIPVLSEATQPPAATLVWVGRGEAEVMRNGAWVRSPDFDYEFTVEQRRFETHWESVKLLRRRHPGYDGSAGPREQTMYFRLDYTPDDPQRGVRSKVTSSLGNGTGAADREFRSARLSMRAEVSAWAPFDTYRIEQTYRYEQGALEEEVSLLKGEVPWVRNRERATLFAPHQFEGAPTAMK